MAKALFMALGLALLPSVAIADDLVHTWSVPSFLLGTVSQPQALVVMDGKGRPVFTIDTDKRAIIVPDDVEVNETARLVIDAMGPYLHQTAVGAK